MSSNNIDDLIDNWHNSDDEEQQLHEFLGMSWEEYCCWVITPNTQFPIITM
jgi:hypothetical protein